MEWFAKIRVCLIVATAFIIITLAVAFSVLRAVLPHATGYLAEVDQALEQQLGLPVKIAAMDADMSWLQPRLKLLDVRIYNADGKSILVEFKEVIFSLSYLDSIRYMSPMIGEISLSGADLSIERDQQRHWFLQGVQVATDDSEQISEELVNFINNTSFSLLNSKLRFSDRTRVFEDMVFENVNIQVENMLGMHAVQVSVDLPGNYGAGLQLVAEINGDLSKPKTANADIYLNVKSLRLEPLFDKFKLEDGIGVKGFANAELWFTVDSMDVKQFKSRGNFTQLEIQSADRKQHWMADSVSANVFWQRYSEAWRLDITGLTMSRNGNTWAQPASLLLRDNAISGYQISASYFHLADLTGLLPVLMGKRYPEIVEQASSLNLQGDVYNLNVLLPPEDKAIATGRNPELRAVFHDLGLTSTEHAISFSGADGSLEYTADKMHLFLASDNVSAEMASLFRQPLQLQTLETVLVVTRDNQDWTLSTDSIVMKNPDITTRSRLYAFWPETGNFYLDMQTDFRNATGDAVAKYYPAGIMSEAAVSWLESALSGGRVDFGGFVFKGNVSEFPFLTNQGVMQVQFQVNDAMLKFLPDWPALENMSARVRFQNQSLHIDNASARVYHGRLYDASATIDNLQSIQLNVDAAISASAEDVQQYIWNSGLNSILGGAMHQLQIIGDLDIGLKLAIPVDAHDMPVRTQGTVQFRNNVLEIPAMNYQLTDLQGELRFSEQSIDSESMSARFAGAPVSLSATSVDSPYRQSVFKISGRWPTDRLLKRFEWLPVEWLNGASDWDLAVHVPLVSEEDLRITATSTLRGTAISISDKLSKTADELLPIQLTLKLADKTMQLAVNSQDVLDVLADRDVNDRWRLRIDAPWLRGEVDFDDGMANDSVLEINLAYADLYSLVKTQELGANSSELKPESIPNLNFHADRLDWNTWKLTDVGMKGRHHSHGMQIEDISIHSQNLEIRGSGNWLSSWQRPHETNFNLQVRSGHLGDALTGLGHAGIVDRGELEASIDWQWLAEPYRFSLDAVSGAAKFKLEKGAMLEVKPGAGGRLLGLLNVLQLPQRLRLDFGDVYKEGFVFNTITGDIGFSAGDANTRNVKIEAASAIINIDGRIGLTAEDYDLNMEVRPNSSAATFATGTIAGGPVVGAGLVLLEKLFGVDKLTREKYTITGKWDNPVIEKPGSAEKRGNLNEADE